MLAEGLVTPERCLALGGVKLAAMGRLGLERSRPFASGRPAILYNPHFDRAFSSFSTFAERLRAFVLAGDQYDLVIAPHVRLAEHWSEPNAPTGKRAPFPAGSSSTSVRSIPSTWITRSAAISTSAT